MICRKAVAAQQREIFDVGGGFGLPAIHLIIEFHFNGRIPRDAKAQHERLARLARLRWMIELDYRQLKGELGLDHYEGRSYLGFHHHCALVTAAHGFLTLERQNPNRQRPA